MSWTVYGNAYETDADYNNGVLSARVKFDNNIILRYVRTWIILYNDPGMTNVTMKICTDTPVTEVQGAKLHDSLTTFTKAQISTKAHGIYELYFEFDDVSLDKDTWYHFVLYGASSGLSATSQVAWKSSFPYPVYIGGNPVVANLPSYPYDLYFIGADL